MVDALEQTLQKQVKLLTCHIPHQWHKHKVPNAKGGNGGLQSSVSKTAAEKRHFITSCPVVKPRWALLRQCSLMVSCPTQAQAKRRQALNIPKHCNSFIWFVLMQHYSPGTHGGPTLLVQSALWITYLPKKQTGQRPAGGKQRTTGPSNKVIQ